MAEEKPASEPVAGAADGVALGMAIQRASPAVDDELTGYLRDQRHHLNEQLKQIHLDIWEKRMGVLLRVATMVMGLAVAGALAWMVRDASLSDGLLVEPFSVPPDLAARGMTGEVVATRLLDRLTLMQSQTNTARPARSYTNAWSEQDFKLEIPETGVSLAELDNWLREKLGHDIRVTGEIVRTASGIDVRVRAGGQGAESASGADSDADQLVEKAAESVYRLTEPYRYAIFLMRHEYRPADAAPIFKSLALSGSPDDRLWSYNMWAQAAGIAAGDKELELRMYRQAHAANPDAIPVYTNLVGMQLDLGLYEGALQTYGEWQAAEKRAGLNLSPLSQTEHAMMMGAYHQATPTLARDVETGVPGFPQQGLLNRLEQSQIGEHDLAAARQTLAQFPPGPPAQLFDAVISFQMGDWKKVLLLSDVQAAYLKDNPHDRRFALVNYSPYLALAEARLGDFTSAERSIAATPGDCYRCLIARGQIADMQKQSARADWWFARAMQAGPSLPFAPAAWGLALLGRGDQNGAIEKFKLANQKSPQFADALAGWGEALVAKKDLRGAAGKFEEAAKYAPNWGRLHLKWGEALAAAGKSDDARKQFAEAAGLDLTAAEKAELAAVGRGWIESP